MSVFEVWAPERDRVRVQIGDGETPHELTRAEDGWWRVDILGAGPGTDYAYLIGDDPTPLPDPRSRHQPQGVHGPSRLFNAEAFAWTDHAWTGRALPGSVLYELHIGTFTPGGTFDSAIERLDYLVELGIDLVEVLPVNAVDGPRNWGYDGVLWYAVTENYGGPVAFQRFVDACHHRGLGVVLDVVHNHLGPSGAYLDRFGPYFAGSNIWGPSLNLDGPESDEVRRYVIDNALMWLRDFHVDALRLDAVHALRDSRAVHLLEELAVEVQALSAHVRRPLTLIAESDLNDPRLITAREGGGYGLDAQWDDDVHHQLHATLTGERQGYYVDFGTPAGLASTLGGAYFHTDTTSEFRHRRHGRPVDTTLLPGHRFLAYLQNHDQIGNRAAGDRLSATLSPGLLSCGAALLLCSPYTPMLFMGEEWGASTPWQFFSYFPDDQLREKVRIGRTQEFAEHGWGATEVPDPNAESTFTDSKLAWSEREEEPHAGLLRTYRELLALRRARPELSDPWLHRFEVSINGVSGPDLERETATKTVVLHRGRLRVVVNLSGTPAAVRLDGPVVEVLLGELSTETSDTTVTVPAESFAVIEIGSPR
ncbi:MAG TPA: malto-oligosyltrehalose trehalohydrolase [Pseudonocardia sp.]|nr:malto-oligosyltrehalose trehalohydrolase [Pseudonocardia sp.]